MESSRLLLMLSAAFLALAALIAAGVVAYGHQRRERSSRVVMDALNRSGVMAPAAPGKPANILNSLDGEEALPEHWLNTSFGKALVAEEDRILLGRCG